MVHIDLSELPPGLFVSFMLCAPASMNGLAEAEEAFYIVRDDYPCEARGLDLMDRAVCRLRDLWHGNPCAPDLEENGWRVDVDGWFTRPTVGRERPDLLLARSGSVIFRTAAEARAFDNKTAQWSGTKTRND